MPPLLTACQSRWALHSLVAILSAVAIASSSAPVSGTGMYNGMMGDLRGVVVIVGGVGLLGIGLLRAASFLPRPWRVYTDRIEFTFVAMLWIVWTSATMAFSHFTVDRGVCFNPDNRAKGELHLPSCPLLTFDLALLHLLSTSTLALMLVVLSTVLAPGYHLSHSTSYDADAEQLQSSPKGGGLVLWDLALAPIEQGAGERERLHVERYGATEPETSGSGSGTSDAQEAGTVGILPRDKFAEGRVTSYGLLLACSLGVVGSAAAIAGGDATGGSPFILAVGAISSVFSTACLALHFSRRGHVAGKLDDTFLARHDRAIEVAGAASLFLLWPLAAVIYTLLPAMAYRPCADPATSSTPAPDLESPASPQTLCYFSCAAISLAWLAAWVVLVRMLGLVFPMPELGWTPKREAYEGPEARGLLAPEPERHRGHDVVVEEMDDEEAGDEEDKFALRSKPSWSSRVRGYVPKRKSKSTPSQTVLSSSPPPPPPRPQVKWGRLVAGEEFELEDDADDE